MLRSAFQNAGDLYQDIQLVSIQYAITPQMKCHATPASFIPFDVDIYRL